MTEFGRIQMFLFVVMLDQFSGAATTKPTTTSTSTTTSAKPVMAKSPATENPQAVWFRFTIVSGGLAALILTAVMVDSWQRSKETKTQMDDDDKDESGAGTCSTV